MDKSRADDSVDIAPIVFPQSLQFEKTSKKGTKTLDQINYAINEAKNQGKPFMYLPIKNVEDWSHYVQESAEMTDRLKDVLGKEAQDARIYSLIADLSAYDALDPFKANYFKDWTKENNERHFDALQKLGGRTSMATWAFEMLPVYKTYLALKNLWDHATSPKEKKKGEPYVKLPEGGMIWDAEQYWDYVRFVKENITEQYLKTLDVIKDIPDKNIRDDVEDLFQNYCRCNIGLLGESAIPFVANSKQDLNNHVKRLTKLEKERKITYKDPKKQEIAPYQTLMNLLEYGGSQDINKYTPAPESRRYGGLKLNPAANKYKRLKPTYRALHKFQAG